MEYKYGWTVKWLALVALQLHNIAGNSMQLISTSVPFETATYFNTTTTQINSIFVFTNLINVICFLPLILITDYFGPNPNFYLSAISAVSTVSAAEKLESEV